MSKLKAGSLTDFSDSMAESIEHALQDEWRAFYGVVLPIEGQDERRIMLVAIARGVLTYLKTHEAEILTSITLDSGLGSTTSTVRHLEVNV